MEHKFSKPMIVLWVALSLSLGCGLLSRTPPAQPQPQVMGTILIVNSYTRGSDSFPGGMGLPVTREYGVCISSYNPEEPSALIRPTFDLILAKDSQTTTYQLPPGTYTLQEWRMDSEINQDPLYSPACKTYVRPTETLFVTAGSTYVFGSVFGSDRTLPEPGAFVEGNPTNPNCGGCSQGFGEFPTAIPTASPAPTSEGVEVEFFAIRSIGAAYNGATAPATFTIYESWLVTYIATYHWNDAQGAEPGTIALQSSDGTVYGPWQATSLPGQGGVPNAYWIVNPGIVIPAGTYTVIDSDPGTWAQNQETGGAGMSWGNGIPQGNP